MVTPEVFDYEAYLETINLLVDLSMPQYLNVLANAGVPEEDILRVGANVAEYSKSGLRKATSFSIFVDEIS